MDKPTIKDKKITEYVNFLEEKLKSPYCKSYLAIKETIDRWNAQLKDTEINILDPEQKAVFEMAHKYMTELKPYIETLKYLEGLMTPQEKEKVSKRDEQTGAVETFLSDAGGVR